MQVSADDTQIRREITFMGQNLLVLPAQVGETPEQLLLHSLKCNNSVKICSFPFQRPNPECPEVIQKLFVAERRCRSSCKLQESADGFIALCKAVAPSADTKASACAPLLGVPCPGVCEAIPSW